MRVFYYPLGPSSISDLWMGSGSCVHGSMFGVLLDREFVTNSRSNSTPNMEPWTQDPEPIHIVLYSMARYYYMIESNLITLQIPAAIRSQVRFPVHADIIKSHIYSTSNFLGAFGILSVKSKNMASNRKEQSMRHIFIIRHHWKYKLDLKHALIVFAFYVSLYLFIFQLFKINRNILNKIKMSVGNRDTSGRMTTRPSPVIITSTRFESDRFYCDKLHWCVTGWWPKRQMARFFSMAEFKLSKLTRQRLKCRLCSAFKTL